MLSIRDWAETFNAGFQTDAVYIDFLKAFDTGSLNKLLFKLCSYGVCDPLLSWVCAFLVDRTFSVRVNDSYSLPCKVISGIPQGSILGPLLFLLFISDISDGLLNVCRLFADDVKIYRPIVHPEVDFGLLHKDLDNLNLWARG